MKFSESWLRTRCDPKLDTQELAHALTMAGLEVENVKPVSKKFTGVVVGQIENIKPHPNADRLRICEVAVGDNAKMSIICGANNLKTLMKVACALPGAVLPAGKIKKTKLRGVESNGMLCSERELGISNEHDGIWEVTEDALVRRDIRDIYDLDDSVFSLKLTPNRGDCLSILGIAREVSAITNTPAKKEFMKTPKIELDRIFPVKVSDRLACPVYSGRIIEGVNLSKQTPPLIVQRLARSGIRSINPVVDLTNYVMVETGQPMHAFDLDRLSGSIDVKFAKPGDELKLLNEQQVRLSTDHLTINDSSGPVALAGIMGGTDSAVNDNTKNLFLESAYFSAEVVAGKWRELGFTTDALHRYERGVDPNLNRAALDYLSYLITDVCGGRCGPVSTTSDKKIVNLPVKMRVSKCEKVLGFKIGSDKVASIFKRLNLPATLEGETFNVKPPTYRFDIKIEEDLIEEVARVDGYDNLPAILPDKLGSFTGLDNKVKTISQLKKYLASREYSEVLTFSFIDNNLELDFGKSELDALKLKNPIAKNLSVMRTSLMGSLVSCLKYNINRYNERVRLFEVSRVFYLAKGGINQPYVCAGIAYGPAEVEQWGHSKRSVDFYDVKADLSTLFKNKQVNYVRSDKEFLHPGKSANIICESNNIGYVGELHPRLLTKYDIPQGAVAFEFTVADLELLAMNKHQSISKYPSVVRDMAITVDEKYGGGEILACIKNLELKIVSGVTLFDVYTGQGINKGEKGLAFRVLLQDTNKTMEDSEIDQAIEKIFKVLEEAFSAVPRR